MTTPFTPSTPFGPPPPPPPQAPVPAQADGGPFAPGSGHAATGTRALAGWAPRFLAYVLDHLLSLVPLLVGIVLANVVLGLGTDHSTGEAPTVVNVVGPSLGMLAMVGGIALAVWNRGIRQGRTGRSLGKSAAGIRLVRQQDGGTAGTGTALLRDVAHIADGPLYLGFLWPLWDPERQTFADKMVSTVVIKG